MAPVSVVLVLEQGSNDYIEKGGVISTDYFFVLKICLIVSLYVMLEFFLNNFLLEFRKHIGLNNPGILKIISLAL